MEETCKICSNCLKEKLFSEYYKQKNGKFGLTSRCKLCHLSYNYAWAAKNPNAFLKGAKIYREKHPEKVRAANRKWRESNKDYDAYRQRERKALKKQAIPKWVSEEGKFLILEVYKLAKLRTELTGFQWHVDHIVPLKHKEACGLHCIENLQVIPWIDNLKKRNLYIG